jgi:hypothetical protein
LKPTIKQHPSPVTVCVLLAPLMLRQPFLTRNYLYTQSRFKSRKKCFSLSLPGKPILEVIFHPIPGQANIGSKLHLRTPFHDLFIYTFLLTIFLELRRKLHARRQLFSSAEHNLQSYTVFASYYLWNSIVHYQVLFRWR